MDAVHPGSSKDFSKGSQEGSQKAQSHRARSRTRSASSARRLSWLIVAVACLVISGCATQGGGVQEGFLMKLQSAGLKQGKAQPSELPIRLYAGDNLNAGDNGKAAALVVRVYQLRDAKRFDEAAFDVFLDERREQDVLGEDLISVTEFLLAPGKRHEVVEALPADGTHMGVVALFRAPAPTRWRFTFDTRQATAEGITVGLHGCAMTTASPALTTRLSTPAHSLSSSRCGPSGG